MPHRPFAPENIPTNASPGPSIAGAQFAAESFRVFFRKAESTRADNQDVKAAMFGQSANAAQLEVFSTCSEATRYREAAAARTNRSRSRESGAPFAAMRCAKICHRERQRSSVAQNRHPSGPLSPGPANRRLRRRLLARTPDNRDASRAERFRNLYSPEDRSH